MPSYAFLPAREALTCALPPGGLSVQLVGRLAHADAESGCAELATAPPSLARASLLHLRTHLVPAEHLPPPPADVHVLGLLQDCPATGGAPGALLRVLRVDLLRAAPGVDVALLERTLAARASLLGAGGGAVGAAQADGCSTGGSSGTAAEAALAVASAAAAAAAAAEDAAAPAAAMS